MSRYGYRMRPGVPQRRTCRPGGAWGAGLGVLGLLVTTAIILVLFKSELDPMTTPGGTFRALDEANKLVQGVNQRSANLTRTIEQQGSPTSSPAPMPAPAGGPPSSGGPAPSGGTPSGGETIGPITPVTPIAPIQEGPGANYRSTTNPVNNMNDGMQKRNEELEKALQGN